MFSVQIEHKGTTFLNWAKRVCALVDSGLLTYILNILHFKACTKTCFEKVTNEYKVLMSCERLQILFKWFNLDSYYPRPDSMYNCALSQSSHVDCQTLICVNPCQTWIRFRLIELVSMHLIMLMRLEPREVW